MKANPLGGATLVLSETLAARSIGSAAVILDNYELTDQAIVRDFELLPAEKSRAVESIRGRFARIRAFAESNQQRFALVRWKNGIECLVCWDHSLSYPLPEQLLRAYKNAFATRLLMQSEKAPGTL